MQTLTAVPDLLHISAQALDDDPVTALLLSRLPVAALLLDAEGRVVKANAAGRAILDEDDGLTRRPGGRLRATIALENGRLQKMLAPLLAAARHGGAQAGPYTPLRLHRPSGRMPYLLLMDSIRSRAGPFEDQPVLLLRIIDPDPEPEARLYPLQAAFELTAAESRIAELIATGRSPGRTAQDLALSRNTVRTHLARIFDKTGVRSQHALVRLLMALGSWPTA